MMDAVENTTCDDLDATKSPTVRQMIPSDVAELENASVVGEANPELLVNSSESKTLRDINPDVMKSMDEGIDSLLGEDSISISTSDLTGEKINSTDSLTVPDSTSQPGSDQESKENEQNVKSEETNLENFKDHGVISLHYPEEDVQSAVDLDATEQVTQFINCE